MLIFVLMCVGYFLAQVLQRFGQDGFTKSSAPVKWFWEVVHNLSPEEKRSLLQPGCPEGFWLEFWLEKWLIFSVCHV
jgi:hypothetical protein